MPPPRIAHKRQIVQGVLIATALLGTVHDIKIAANQYLEVTFMVHIAKNFRPTEKLQLQLQLLNGARPTASVTVSP
ncbi:MAG: hypothetical protein PVSMB11_12310 [Desulfuromonadaceae bacterium]